MKKPWETEDWHKAKGIIADETQTNSALAERDYSVPCEVKSEGIIQVVAGYWIWWCPTHHQPLSWCDLAKARQTVQTMREALEEISQGKGPYSMDRLTQPSSSYAENTIKDMTELAAKALATTEPAGAKVEGKGGS